jgi:hypothetical protein
MTVALWIVAGLLALAFLVAGLAKLIQPRAKLEIRMGYVADFTDVQLIFAAQQIKRRGKPGERRARSRLEVGFA